MNTPDRRSETGSPVAPDVVAVNDRELETCKGDLWRIIAQVSLAHPHFYQAHVFNPGYCFGGPRWNHLCCHE